MGMAKLKSSGSGYNAELDDTERASRDEIKALQTQRLAWSLQHAYDNVAHYKKAFDAAGVHPSDFKRSRISPISVHGEDRPARQLSLQDVRSAARKAGARACLVGHHRQADRGRLHQADIDIWADVMARSIRAAGGRTGMIMHIAYGYGLFTGGLGAHYGAESSAAPSFRLRRHDRAAGAADPRFRARHHHGDAELHAGHPRRVRQRASIRANPR